MAEETRRLKAEIVHSLFLDLVGYSRHAIEQQKRLVEELRSLVRPAPEFQRAEAEGELLRLDRGDGVALVFFRDPIAPAQCAVEIARALQGRPHLQLRMGIHSGPITHATDIADHANVYGGGINMAQRVMDCGDAGHILLSQRSAEDLRQFEEWEPYLHDLGEVEVKHGERLRLYNLCLPDVGNPERPRKLEVEKGRKGDEETKSLLPDYGLQTVSPSEKSASALRPFPSSPKVALLYKRNVAPDDSLRNLLEKELRAAGYDVFLDRNLQIGVEWVQAIEREIGESEAIIPLLSEASVRSEMLEYEIQRASEIAQTRNGKPRLLPLRVNFTGPLPDALGGILDPLHYALWQGPEDDARLVAELLQALRTPPPPPATTPLESVGGAVPLDSAFYIVRPVDAEFKTAIARQDSVVLVKGARQMGKTSLLARGLQQARQAGAKVVYTDFQTFNAKHLESVDALLLTLATLLAAKLGLRVSPRDTWYPELGANMNMDWFLETEVLGKVTGPVVWGLDEVDRLFGCDFGSEVFGLFRSWHNRRAAEPDGPWGRLTLAIVYATEAHLFITDLNQSPFNVGTRLTLADFTPEQVAELNRRYGAPLKDAEEQARFYRLVSGHPYLVRRGLDELTAQGNALAMLETKADEDEGLFGDHLRRLLVAVLQDPELTDALKAVLRGQPCPTSESFYRLRTAGVLIGASYREAHPRCHLYTAYLSRHLL